MRKAYFITGVLAIIAGIPLLFVKWWVGLLVSSGGGVIYDLGKKICPVCGGKSNGNDRSYFKGRWEHVVYECSRDRSHTWEHVKFWDSFARIGGKWGTGEK